MLTSFTRFGPGPVSPYASEHRVPMRDGVSLATDVYLGESETAQPAILVRLPYDKNGAYTYMDRVARYANERGYAFVVQDVRGKFRSEGETIPFVNETYDGYDTIDWVSQQPWCDGSVAMWGDSYFGFTQWAAASSEHPALKAISPRLTGTGLGEIPAVSPKDNTVEMSVGLHYLLTWFLDRDGFDWTPDWAQRPLTAQIERYLAEVGSRSSGYDLWYPHPVALRRFPNGSPFDRTAVPTLLTIGWWDNCAPWSWRDLDSIRERPDWTDATYLRLESIDHENTAFIRHDERSDRERMIALMEPALEFFDIFVKKIGKPDDIARVTWNLAGTQGYRTSPSWPPAGVQNRFYDLNKNGSLVERARSTAGDFESDDVVSWTHDPHNPVPSSVPDEFAFLRYQPDESATASRDDVLVFSGEAELHDVDLVGPVSLSVQFQGSAPRNDLFVRLYDRSPDGALHRIARGQVQLAGTELHEVSVDLGHLGYRFRAGHALQLHLQSSDYPEWVLQPGTSDEPWSASTLHSSTSEVHVGGTRAALTVSTLPSVR